MYMTGFGKRQIVYEWDEKSKKVNPALLALRLINIYSPLWPRC